MARIQAKDPACEAYNKTLLEDLLQKGFYHSIPLPDGRVLKGVIPLEALRERVDEFPIPASLAGKRVLDIGTWDGFFAFEMERRGAEVVAIDSTEIENFHTAHSLLNSGVEYHVQDVCELTPERNGTFDIVFFMGVLYHLKHPLLALERVCGVTREMAIVESFVTNEGVTGEIPTLQFYETNELLGQVDNWCGPNVQCLLAMCRTAGFARAELIRVSNAQRAVAACYRHWQPEPAAPAAEPPLLIACTHAGNYGVNASMAKDDYLTAFFKSAESGLTNDNVLPEVGGFAVRPIAVHSTGADGWQASFRIPPGLSAGWHEVRLRTAASRYSGMVRIALDVPAHSDSIRIASASRPGDDAVLSLRVDGLPVNGDRGNVRITLGGARLEIHDVSAHSATEPRRIDVKLPKGFPAGHYELLVSLGATKSAPFSIKVN